LIGGFRINNAVEMRGWSRGNSRRSSGKREEESEQREKGSEHGSLRPGMANSTLAGSKMVVETIGAKEGHNPGTFAGV